MFDIISEIFAEINIADWIGRTEKELAGHLENLAWTKGGDGRSFDPVLQRYDR